MNWLGLALVILALQLGCQASTTTDQFYQRIGFACQNLDDPRNKVIIDVAAGLAGKTLTVEELRREREAFCLVFTGG